MIDYVLSAIIVGILFFAIRKIVKDNRRAKENGTCATCVGCPHASKCSSK
jgi:hypothetical protein